MKSDRNKEATTWAVASFCHCMRSTSKQRLEVELHRQLNQPR